MAKDKVTQRQHSNLGNLVGEPRGKRTEEMEYVTQKLEQSGLKEKYHHPLI